MHGQLLEVEPVKRLLSFRSTSRPEPDETTQILGFNDREADEVFKTLASQTTRDVFEAVYDRPGTTSEIADDVDTSLQNAKYHLDKLQEADLIEVADTWYSEQGNEMKVYAPTNESVVLFAGDESRQSSIRKALTRLLGTVVVLIGGSLLVEWLRPSRYLVREPPVFPSWIPFSEGVASISPGLLFFTGGLTALFVISGFVLWESANGY